jgi:hypothetical protein
LIDSKIVRSVQLQVENTITAKRKRRDETDVEEMGREERLKRYDFFLRRCAATGSQCELILVQAISYLSNFFTGVQSLRSLVARIV